MTLDTFFDKFDIFADAPNAVAKMRELVLELAIEGKLVDRKKGDGNADQLLAEISSEREARASMLRTPKEPVLSDDCEHAFQIPTSWIWTQLGNIALQIQYGYTASADHSSTEVRMLRITDIQNNRVNWPSVPGCEIKPSEAEKYLLIPNDILIARTGGTIGKSFIIPDAPVRSVFASYLIRVTPPKAMDARYLKIFLETPFYWTQLQTMSAGTGQPNVNGQALGRLEIPLPPLAEQKRIVANVDELMALCDRLEAQQKERQQQHAALYRASLARFAEAPTPVSLPFLFHPSYAIPPADLRKSILTLAVQGKLVPQDPNDEPAEDLLKRSHAERKKLKRTDSQEVEPLSADDTLGYDIPESWRWQRLNDLLVFGPTNGFSPKAVDYETPVRSLTLSATTSGSFKGQHSKFITTDVPADSDLWLRDGDILVQRGNTIEYVGVAAVYRGEANCFVYPDLMMKLRVSSAFDVGYVHLAMSHEASRDFLRARASGTSGSMPKINQTTLKSLPLPLPPLAEQRRIVAKVEQLMPLVDELEAQITVSRATAAKLLSALVAELTTPKESHEAVAV